MRWFSLFFLLSLTSCSPRKEKPHQISDEYVLVEFASKLEEDYEHLGKVNSKQ